MKDTLKIAVAVLCLSAAVFVSQASAVYVPPQTSGETSLQEILDTYFGSRVIDVAATPCQGELFVCNSPTGYMIKEIADFQNSNTLSWYNPSDIQDTGVVFPGPYNEGMSPVPFDPQINPFGFLLTTPQGQTYYSQTNLNGDEQDHFWVFLNPLYSSDEPGRVEYIIAVEDYLGGFDQDHNDMVFAISGITPTNPVPEPGTLMLLGSGLIGAVGFARRKLS